MKLAIGLAALVFAAACSSQQLTRATLDNTPKPSQLRTLPGTSLELREIAGGSSYGHASDQENPDKIGDVDVASTLRLTFHTPPADTALAADPEWKAVRDALDQLRTMQGRYGELQRTAASLSKTPNADPAPLHSQVKLFGDTQRAFVTRVFGIDAQDNSKDTGQGIFRRQELHSMIDASPSTSLYDDLNHALSTRIQALVSKAKQLANSTNDYLVTVRATLEPEAGTEQFLQVPNYYNKSADALADDLRRSRTKEIDKLRAEYAAAQEVAAMIEELRKNGSSLGDALKHMLDDARESLTKSFDAWLGDIDAKLAAILAGTPPASDDAAKLWKDLGELASQIRAVKSLLDQSGALDPTKSALDRLQALLSITGELLKHVQGGDGSRSWTELVQAILADVPAAASEELKTLASKVKSDLGDLLKSALAKTLDGLPKTKSAIETILPAFQSGHQLIAASANLPKDTGTDIPHPPDDLPPAEIDLKRTPTTAGDRLKLEVQVWNRAEYEDDRKNGTSAAKPLETVSYTNDAIKQGWLLSGDVIFAKPTSGRTDQFTSQAAVSYEWHHRYRDVGNGWERLWNAIDPGFGFHAAALNFDPNVTTEIGVGGNASLFSGLVRFGYGWDVSIGANKEYWYFGFGLISALDHIKDLGTSVFDKK